MPAKIPIDEEQVYKLAIMHCSNKEIAAFFGVHIDTLTDRFSEILHKGREEGKTRLRRAQWEAALKGNVAMMIWLGKQYLEQTEKIEQKTEDVTNRVIRIELQREDTDAPDKLREANTAAIEAGPIEVKI